ncbi:MAG: NrfD/PsrC family molybdoenzyme membrane anchor subunit [Dehalococcoidia bacterium]
MATRAEARALPYGMGRVGVGWLLITLGLLALVGLGAYAYARQVMEGEVATGMRDVGTTAGATWGLYVAFELYAVGVGFGAMVLLALVRLMGLSHLHPLSRPLGLTALAALLVGALSIIADVGQPVRAIVNLLRYARPMSPFFGTFSVGVITSLVATATYLYLDSRRDAALLARQSTGWRRFLRAIAAGYPMTSEAQRQRQQERRQRVSLGLALVLLVAGVVAASTSGLVFGIQWGRPGWYSALQGPSFVVLAGVSATGIIIVIAAVLREVLGERERLNPRVFAWLSNLLMALTIIYISFLLLEFLASGYAGPGYEVQVTDALLKGQYAWLFWLSGGLFVLSVALGAGQALVRRYSLPLIVLSGVLVNLAAIGKRYLIVVPSLTHGALLPYGPGYYAPTWVEYSVVLGLFALGMFLYLLFIKLFPIMEVQEEGR